MLIAFLIIGALLALLLSKTFPDLGTFKTSLIASGFVFVALLALIFFGAP